MTPRSLTTTLLPAAQEALRTLLKTLTGTPVPLEAGTPEKSAGPEEAGNAWRADAEARFTLYDAEHGMAVALAPAWVPLLSEAMLGEAMEAGDDGVADLMQEIAAQGFGVVQTALASEGQDVPALTFEALPPGQPLPPPPGEAAAFWKVPFSARHDGADLDGFALLPADAETDEAETANADTAKAADAEIEAGGGNAPSSAEQRSQPSAASQPAAAPQANAPQAAGEGASAPQTEAVDVAPAAFADLGREDLNGDGGSGGGGSGGGGPGNFDLLAEVDLEVTVELGRRHLPLADVLKLTTGSVVELEKLVGEPLSVYANGRLIAEGEAVVIDEQFGVRITNLASKSRRDKAFF